MEPDRTRVPKLVFVVEACSQMTLNGAVPTIFSAICDVICSTTSLTMEVFFFTYCESRLQAYQVSDRGKVHSYEHVDGLDAEEKCYPLTPQSAAILREELPKFFTSMSSSSEETKCSLTRALEQLYGNNFFRDDIHIVAFAMSSHAEELVTDEVLRWIRIMNSWKLEHLQLDFRILGAKQEHLSILRKLEAAAGTTGGYLSFITVSEINKIVKEIFKPQALLLTTRARVSDGWEASIFNSNRDTEVRITDSVQNVQDHSVLVMLNEIDDRPLEQRLNDLNIQMTSRFTDPETAAIFHRVHNRSFPIERTALLSFALNLQFSVLFIFTVRQAIAFARTLHIEEVTRFVQEAVDRVNVLHGRLPESALLRSWSFRIEWLQKSLNSLMQLLKSDHGCRNVSARSTLASISMAKSQLALRGSLHQLYPRPPNASDILPLGRELPCSIRSMNPNSAYLLSRGPLGALIWIGYRVPLEWVRSVFGTTHVPATAPEVLGAVISAPHNRSESSTIVRRVMDQNRISKLAVFLQGCEDEWLFHSNLDDGVSLRS